ncbi:MAG: TQO small subunit DoxD [Dehalococcoidia bacterium]
MSLTSLRMDSDTADWPDARPRDRLLALGLIVLRVGLGIVLLTNTYSKLGPQTDRIPPFQGFLITLDGARNILAYDVQGHPIELYRRFIEDVVLAHWGLFGTVLVLSEGVVGLCLLLGAFTPLAALTGAGMFLHLAFANIHRQDKWLFEYWIEALPMVTLALTRAGRYWGVDAALARRFPRWPIT